MTVTVDALIVLAGLLGVATGAIHGLRRLVVIGMLRGQVGMTTGAGVGVMDRHLEQGFVDEEGNIFPVGALLRQRLVAVAFEAITVLDGLGSRRY